MMRREWLIHLRKSRKWTQEEVAEKSFIDRAYYAQIENGKRDPSFNVVLSLSKTLGFEPEVFFQEFLKTKTSPSQENKIQTPASLATMDAGQVLYIYSNLENYLTHLLSYLTTAMQKNVQALVIDHCVHLSAIEQRLAELPNHEIASRFVSYLDIQDYHKDTESIDRNLSTMLQIREGNGPIRIWLHTEGENQEQTNQLYQNENDSIQKKISQAVGQETYLFVKAFDSNLLTASKQIMMMRNHHYLMTDMELVVSPLHPTHTMIFPSLSNQS